LDLVLLPRTVLWWVWVASLCRCRLDYFPLI
jgi:hypothetical protein